MKYINIWMGGLFSPPTLRDIKIAYNTASYISNIYPKRKIKLFMVPTNKYYVSPLTNCVEEKDRITMLRLLLKYVKKNLNIPKNIQIIISEKDIKYGKKFHQPSNINDSIKSFNSTNPFYIILNLENVINLVKGNWDDDTHFGFSEKKGFSIDLLLNTKIIVIPTFSDLVELDENQKHNYINKNIDLSKLLKSDIPNILKNKSIKQQKHLLMSNFIILPEKFVPENLKTISSKKVIEELDNYYSSLNKINELSSKKVTEYITKKKLYKNCYNYNRTKKIKNLSKQKRKSKNIRSTKKKYKK
jgi:hypothetical protein